MSVPGSGCSGYARRYIQLAPDSEQSAKFDRVANDECSVHGLGRSTRSCSRAAMARMSALIVSRWRHPVGMDSMP